MYYYNSEIQRKIFDLILPAGLISGVSGAFGSFLFPECAAEAGGALGVFGACFIGSSIIIIPAYAAISELTDGLRKSIGCNHSALIFTWGTLLVSAMGVLMLASVAIGSGVLGISTYDVAKCFLAGSLTASICYVTPAIFLDWLHKVTEQASTAAREEADGQPGNPRQNRC